MWENVKVEAGDVLRFTFLKQGVKAYVCVSGGIKVPKVLGSYSTYQLTKLGGYHGRKLMMGDLLPLGEPLPGVFKQVGKRIPPSFIPEYSEYHDIRVVMGLSGSLISDEGVKSFLNSEWKVSVESNRVAYRYQGASVTFRDVDVPFGIGDASLNVVDMAYPIGMIMVPNEEEIIVLLNDGTSGGGFVTIGTVITPDLDRIAQSRPMTSSRFLAVTFDQAMSARLERQRTISMLTNILK